MIVKKIGIGQAVIYFTLETRVEKGGQPNSHLQ